MVVDSNFFTLWLNQWRFPGFYVPGRQAEPALWLTIDDGPSSRFSILNDFLQSTNTPALHFFSADKTESLNSLPELPAGSAFGLHGYSHCRYNQLTLDELIGEIEHCKQSPLLNHPQFLPFFRPPYGSWRPGLHTLIREAGWLPLYWGFLPGDWLPSFQPDQLRKTSQRWLKPGMILVLHEKENQTDRLIHSIEVVRQLCNETGLLIGRWK